jgi:hypothetical protein
MAATNPSPPVSFTTTAIYDAVEGLKELGIEAYSILEGPGDLVMLRDQLGFIRDRADTIQNAVIGFIQAIEQNL